jgi:iron complex transport system permease protein
VLGLSGGAACGALTALLVGAAALVTPAAFAGALVSTVVVFGLARGRSTWAPTRLLLTGIVIAAGWGALIMLLLTVAPEAQVRGMLFWLIGDLSRATAAACPCGARDRARRRHVVARDATPPRAAT